MRFGARPTSAWGGGPSAEWEMFVSFFVLSYFFDAGLPALNLRRPLPEFLVPHAPELVGQPATVGPVEE